MARINPSRKPPIFGSGASAESPRIVAIGGAAMWQKFLDWWHGKFVENDPNFPLIFFMIDRHWTAQWARDGLDYLKEHHRWVIGVWWRPALVQCITFASEIGRASSGRRQLSAALVGRIVSPLAPPGADGSRRLGATANLGEIGVTCSEFRVAAYLYANRKRRYN
jgi:hypothetical protein